ncbi:MAG: phage portal protein [Kiloniellales bacterium]
MGLRDAWTALTRREVKASRAGPLIALQQPGRAVWSPRRFDAFAEEAYQKNVIGFRAINQVARSAASVPWRLARRRGQALHRLETHPLLDLLGRPNPMMAHSEFIEAVVGFYLIAGNAFIEAVPATGEPRELWPLRPDRMKVVAGKTGLPKGFVFTLGGAERRWEADPVSGRATILHLKTFHPLDDWYGLSPVEPAGFAIDQRNESDKWNMALLQNGARPSGALVYQPQGGAAANLSDEQFARLRQEIAEQYGGAKNAGRPMLLDGGLTWQEMSLSPKDMDFLEARHAASRDVAQAFGVPPQLLGIPGDNTYSNYQEARLALWEETVIPLLRHLRDEFNAWLAPRFGEDLALEIDLDEIPALTLRREKTWARVRAAEFLTLNEKRELAGFAPVAGGDRVVMRRGERAMGPGAAREGA